VSGFNLSQWALHHRPLVAYIMLVAVVAGVLSYFRLGRAEDPTFVIKTMIVQASWPGATVEETLKQVTERLERWLQETPKLNFLRSFTSAGTTTIFVNLQGNTTARQVPDIWDNVRKSIGDIRYTLPSGIVGPGFNDDFAKQAQAGEDRGWVFRTYRNFLTLAMKLKWVTILLTLGLFAASFLALPLIPRQFFPSSDRPELLVDLGLPQNASIYASETASKRFDALLKNDPDVERWSTYVGRGAIRFYLPLNVQLPNPFFSQAVIVTKDVPARNRLQAKLEKALAEDFPSVVGRVYPLEPGPPVGWPIQYRVSGPDIGQVRDIAFQLAKAISTSPHAKMVHFDWIEPARQVRIRVDQDEARLLGLSSQTIASVLNTVITGVSITQVRDDIYLIDVVVRATDEQRVSLDNLRNVQVPLPNGSTVSLNQFASFDYQQEYPIVWRRDRVPTLTVQADILPGSLPETVVRGLTPAIFELSKTLPSSYRIVTGGTVEESQKSQASVLAVVPVMLLIMLTVLMFQLQSFQRLALVLSAAPLGLIGVVGALLLSRRPLGFVAILGVLALLGMITKNAVILIGQIEAERAQGKDVWQAAIDASSARFRPIMLTAVSTVLGMIPIAPTVFWGPMAFAIMGGLLVGTLLTLIFLPTLYVTWFSFRERRSTS
jgi:multidrug efflux pump subunit AcrB